MTDWRTHRSPHARVYRTEPGAARLTDGFWADRWETCRTQTIPALWSRMEGTDPTHFLQNFRIAAGMVTGRYRGAPFNDGDFYKLLEATCSILAVTNKGDDPFDFRSRVAEAIAIIGKAQRADGYLHTRTLIRQRTGGDGEPFQDPVDFELYNMGHLMTAACVHWRATGGNEDFLRIARKTADFLDEAFRDPGPKLSHLAICPAHYMGILDLFRVTGEPRYLALAKQFLDLRDQTPPGGGGDDNQDRIPFREQTEAVGHAVRANYLYAGAADLYAETGDHSLWEPLERIWRDMTERKISITGGCGALFDGASPDAATEQATITRTHQSYGRAFQQPQQTAHNETCASIGSLLWNFRMFLVTGEARYMDIVELALFNGILSGVSLHGTDFFYVNPLRKLKETPCSLRWPHERASFFSSFCCPPNLARTIAQVADCFYSVSDDGLQVNLYGGSSISVTLITGPAITLTQETGYPWNGKIHLRFSGFDAAEFTLRLRIPGWAESASVLVNGEIVAKTPVPESYFSLRRIWKSGDTVDLEIPMPPRMMEAHPLVEEARGQVAIRRGPLVYCLESVDLPEGTALRDILLPVNETLTPRHAADLLGGITVLESTALARPAAPETASLYRPLPAHPHGLRSVPLRLVPYFAWGNRNQQAQGAAEMSVWLALHWSPP